MRQVVTLEEGDWYDADALEVDREAGRGGGHARLRLRRGAARLERNRETKTVNITFEINEGPRVFVERIDISGNIRTMDKVIRREFRLVEGDAFDAAKLRRSRQRIQDLDFFEKVNVEQVPGGAPTAPSSRSTCRRNRPARCRSAPASPPAPVFSAT